MSTERGKILSPCSIPPSLGVRLCIVGVSEKFDVTCQLEMLAEATTSLFFLGKDEFHDQVIFPWWLGTKPWESPWYDHCYYHSITMIRWFFEILVLVELGSSVTDQWIFYGDSMLNPHWLVVYLSLWNICESRDDVPFPTVSGKSFKIPWFQSPPTRYY